MSLQTPETNPILLGSDKVTIRRPYGERLSGLRGFDFATEVALDTSGVYVEPARVPQNLYEASDYDLTVTDRQRMKSNEDWTLDPVKVYHGHPTAQKSFLAHEHAMHRLQQTKPHIAAALQARQRIDASVVTTPIVEGSGLVSGTEARILFKAEHLQNQKTFKTRGGALAVQLAIEPGNIEAVAAASAGNHALGVSRAARDFGKPAIIFMAENANPVKIESNRALGATVRLRGRSLYDAAAACREFVANNPSFVEIPAYDDYAVMTGQSTAGVETIEQVPQIDGLWCAYGGGGLISMNAAVIKEYNPRAEVVAVVFEDNDSLIRSLKAGKIVSIEQPNNWCDGTAVRAPGVLPFAYIQKYVDRVVSVSRSQTEQAIVDYFEEYDEVLEPAAAIVLAAMRAEASKLSGTHVGILGGGNASAEIVNALHKSKKIRLDWSRPLVHSMTS